MSGMGSVTLWLNRLKAGETRDEAVTRLWERYFADLVHQAQRHLRGRRRATEGEDVALSAFDRFVRGVEAGKFPRLDDRHDLWQVLLLMTANRAKNAIRDENRSKRGGGRVAQSIGEVDSDSEELPVAAAEPDPAEAAALAEGVEMFLSSLGDPLLRQVAQWRLEGYTVPEIAQMMGRAVATVERKLKLIREVWVGLDETSVGKE